MRMTIVTRMTMSVVLSLPESSGFPGSSTAPVTGFVSRGGVIDLNRRAVLRVVLLPLKINLPTGLMTFYHLMIF